MNREHRCLLERTMFVDCDFPVYIDKFSFVSPPSIPRWVIFGESGTCFPLRFRECTYVRLIKKNYI